MDENRSAHSNSTCNNSDTTPSSLPGVKRPSLPPDVVSTAANKSPALAKRPVQLLRGTSTADNEIRNLRDRFCNEAEEIAHYRVIEDIASPCRRH